eukprot:CAMPEP_0119474924 /NCGR_PEP_ID=MMETSP1344-20130328/5995_1 /TAXON_ID=236787 /ORGANISM="Florenciella parvula, Strain CCMP2471" /LENGTH=167 /DNA_ID=CAMNT_0007508313 /DNA_START=481 /DNA_END=980 /DNA_ORIENTATION=+
MPCTPCRSEKSLEDAAAEAMAELLALDDKDKKKKAKQTGKVKKKTSAAMEFVRNSAAITVSMLDNGGEEVHRHARLEMASEDGQIGGAGGLEQAREASAHDATAPVRGFASKGSSQFVGGLEDMLGDLDDEASGEEDADDQEFRPTASAADSGAWDGEDDDETRASG